MPTSFMTRPLRRLLHASALYLCLAATAAHAGWTSLPSFDGPRAEHTATLLPNGRVWMAGGTSNEEDSGGNLVALSSTRLFDPAANTWANGPELPIGRYAHTATLLPDGTVLLAGGRASSGGPLAVEWAAVTYDPAAGTVTATGPMQQRRSHHTATLMQDGRVLVTGGRGIAGQAALSGAEIYDPATRTWAAALAMPSQKSRHTATLLPNGRVLVVGGYDNGEARTRSAHLYNPVSNTWNAADMPPEASPYAGHTATLLPDGRVLVAGGALGGSQDAATQLFDPATNDWARGPDIGAFRFSPAAAPLPGGSVLIAGGFGIWPTGLTQTISFTPGGGSVTEQPHMSVPRQQYTATALPSGQVLVLGGLTITSGSYTATNTAELYTHDAAALSTPTGVTATPGNGQVTVRWQAPSGGATPESYTVTAQPGGASCTVQHPATSCTVAGLANGTPYTFVVTARAGQDQASTPPSAPFTPSLAAGPGGVQPVPTLSQWGLLTLAVLMLCASLRRRAAL